jgi:soluble lytic murein transglycosylase-like protein
MRPFQELIDQVADQEGIPRPVAQALVDTENIKRDPAIVIKEAWGGGSFGLTMITLRTAQSLGFKGTPGQLLDPRTNLAFGFRYLRQMFDSVAKGSWTNARAAYNAGPDMKPWPAADVARFTANLARWSGPSPGFQKPPILRAGIGGWPMVLIIVGLLLPLLFKKRRHA